MPFGILRACSAASVRWYWAASPMYTFSAVWWTPWSWYQRVRASQLFGYL